MIEPSAMLSSLPLVAICKAHRDGVNHPRLDHAAADGSLGTMIHIAT